MPTSPWTSHWCGVTFSLAGSMTLRGLALGFTSKIFSMRSISILEFGRQTRGLPLGFETTLAPGKEAGAGAIRSCLSLVDSSCSRSRSSDNPVTLGPTLRRCRAYPTFDEGPGKSETPNRESKHA